MSRRVNAPWLRAVLLLDDTRSLDRHVFKRLQIINFLTFVGTITLLVFIFTLNSSQGAVVSNAVTILFFLVINLLARHSKHPEAVFQLGMAVFVFSATYAYLGTSAQRAVMWAPVYPFIAYLFLKMKGVVQWSAIAAALNISLVILSDRGLVELMVDTKIVVYATVLSVVSSVMLIGYQSVSDSYEKRVLEQEDALRAINRELKSELENGKILAEKLSIANQKSNHDLDVLFRTKEAMLNILDDAKEFQEQLERQKATVERRVTKRTAQLSYQRASLKASIEGLSAGYLMMPKDPKGILVYNSAFMRTVNDFRTDVAASEIFRIINKIAGKKYKFKEKVERCITVGKSFHIDEMIVNHSVVFGVEGSPIRLAETREVIGCVMLFTDMTEAKELERSKDEFISIASHELRTPLTAIRGNATMLKEMYGKALKDPDANEVVDDIKDASVRLISVVNGFLDMSRIEQNRIELDITSTDSKKQLMAAIDVLNNLAEQKGLKLMLKVPDTVPNILADSQRFLEIISNLIDNAIKYSEKGTIVVSLKAEKDTVTFLVSDTGKGIPKDSQKHLFKKFRQAGNNIYTRDVSRSTGLGLYICKLLVKQMKGEIYLESSVLGKGSTFAVRLPVDGGKRH